MRQSETAWHEIFLNAPVALSLASVEGRLREVNARYAELMGLAPAALRGRLLSELHLLSDDSSAERIAAELGKHASIDQVANHFQRGDGALQPSLSSLRLVEMGEETLILSSTIDAPDGCAAAQELLETQNQRVGELEAQLSAHREQEYRLIGEISGLCTEASLLKSDIIKLKQMQQVLNSEMQNLRKYAVLAASSQAPPTVHVVSLATTALQTSAASRDAVQMPSVVTPAIHDEDDGPRDALWAVASARLQHVEEQLIKHVAVLREQAARMQSASADT